MAFNPIPYTSGPLSSSSNTATAASTAALPRHLQTFASPLATRDSFQQLLPKNLWPAMGEMKDRGADSLLQRYLTTPLRQTTTWLWNTLGFPNVDLDYLRIAMVWDYEDLRKLFYTFTAGGNPAVELHDRPRVYLRRGVIRFENGDLSLADWLGELRQLKSHLQY